MFKSMAKAHNLSPLMYTYLTIWYTLSSYIGYTDHLSDFLYKCPSEIKDCLLELHIMCSWLIHIISLTI